MTTEFSGVADSNGEDLEGSIGLLKRLGFTDNESKAYLALCESHPATAYEVSKGTQLPRSNVYNVLRSLEMKGAIQAISPNPVRYAPRDPDDFFGQVVKNTRETCQKISENLKKKSGPDKEAYIWTLRGEKTIREKCSELISSAQNNLWLKISTPVLEFHMEEIRLAAERGVQVLIVLTGETPGSLDSVPNVVILPHEGHGVHFEGYVPKFRKAVFEIFSVAVDFREIVMGRLGDVELASCSRNGTMVHLIVNLILHEIYIAEIFTHFAPQIEEMFGPGFSELRKKYQTGVGDQIPFAEWEIGEAIGGNLNNQEEG